MATFSTLCAGLVACAGTGDSTPPTVVRTPPPVGYEKTISDYLAFRIRGPQKNAELRFSPPEASACALDGYAASRRGWVVPVVYATRTGEATGRETITINTRQYYFWFLGNTIAGITPRIESCPGIEAAFGDAAPASATAAALRTISFPAPTTGEAPRGEGVDKPELPARGRGQDRASGAGPKPGAAAAAKSGKSSGHARRGVKKKARSDRLPTGR
ncbi:MAG: hypothetical protein ABI520_07550 [Caldimonas sp.]